VCGNIVAPNLIQRRTRTARRCDRSRRAGTLQERVVIRDIRCQPGGPDWTIPKLIVSPD